MSYAVLIAEPELATRAVSCSDIDQCLQVVATEGKRVRSGTVVNVLRVDLETASPLATWRKDRGKLRRRRP